MEKLARLTGYTAGSASVTFGNIKRKIKLLGEALSEDGPATPKKGAGPGRGKAASTSATPKKRGATASATATPAKRKKTAVAAAAEEQDDDDDEELDFSPSKAETKPKVKSEPDFKPKVTVKKEVPDYSDLTLDEDLQQAEPGHSYGGLLDGIGEFGH
jgi:hypothetical protein